MPPAYDLVIFDLDGTLTPSKGEMEPSMVETFWRLLEAVPVAVISGGQYSQFKKQLLTPLTQGFGNILQPALANNRRAEKEEGEVPPKTLSAQLSRLHLLPTCGTQYFRYEAESYQAGKWACQYRQDLDPALAQKAKRVIQEVCEELGLWSETCYGERIEDRGSQLTFSALGQQAPLELKAEWDPSGSKRIKIANAAQQLLPELSVKSGGSTSVDITMKGVDKAYGINHLLKLTGIPAKQVLFIGDRLDPNGNDYPAISTGVDTRATSGWEETVRILEDVLAGKFVH